MKNKKRSKNFKAGLLITVVALFCVGLLISTLSFQEVVEVRPIKERIRRYRDMGDGDPTGDESGFRALRVYPHQAAPATAYASNLSNASSYEWLYSLNGSATGETPYSTAVDYVVELIVNDTVGYNESSSAWEPTNFVFMNITVDFDWSSDVAWTRMTAVEVANNSDFAWYNLYINNAGAGYQYAKNEDANISLNGTFLW